MADSGTYDPETIARHQKIADALMLQAAKPREIRSRLQGVGQLGEGLLAGIQSGQADKESKDARAAALAQALQAFGGGQQPTAAPAPMPAPIAAPQQTVDNTVPTGTTQAADASLPRGLRNNNPLNIEEGAFTQGQPGFSGSDGRFAKFQTPEQGIGAANALLDSYGRRGLNTPAGIVNRWAPSADGNNTPAYAMAIAKQLGIGPNDAIPPEMRPQLIAAMGQHENGRPIGDVAAALQAPPQAQGGPPPQQVAQNAPAPTTGPNREAIVRALMNPWTPSGVSGLLTQQMSPPELKLTKDMMGADVPNTWDPQRGLWNGQPLQPGIAGGRAGATGLPSNGTPEEILAAADKQYPGVANRVEQLYRGEGALPNARSNKIDAPAMQLIQTVHPDWNMATWTAKNKMIAQLSSGQPSSLGGRLQASQNSFEHLANTSDAAIEKGNFNLGAAPLSAPANYLKSLTTSQRDIGKKMEREALTYGSERTKFLTGAEGTEGERRAFLEALGTDTAAPAQQAGTIEGEYIQMRGALMNEERNIRQTMGDKYLAEHPVITPEVKHAMGKIEKNIEVLRGNKKDETSQSAPAAAAAAPRAINPKTGEQIELRDGKWVPVK